MAPTPEEDALFHLSRFQPRPNSYVADPYFGDIDGRHESDLRDQVDRRQTYRYFLRPSIIHCWDLEAHYPGPPLQSKFVETARLGSNESSQVA